LEKKERRFGDRRDGELLRSLDSMHYIVPLLYPNRCDNEAYISERIDLTNMRDFLRQKNEEDPNINITCSSSLSPPWSRPSLCGRR
jgi:hypothetical protein